MEHTDASQYTNASAFGRHARQRQSYWCRHLYRKHQLCQLRSVYEWSVFDLTPFAGWTSSFLNLNRRRCRQETSYRISSSQVTMNTKRVVVNSTFAYRIQKQLNCRGFEKGDCMPGRSTSNVARRTTARRPRDGWKGFRNPWKNNDARRMFTPPRFSLTPYHKYASIVTTFSPTTLTISTYINIWII